MSCLWIKRTQILNYSRLWSSSSTRSFSKTKSLNNQTFIEKIVQKYAVDLPINQKVRAGDFVMLKPKHVMTHDNTAPVISKFGSIGASKISNPFQPVFTIDHDVQNKSSANLKKYSKIEKFAHEHGIDFYPPGRGIGHQIMIEEGYAFPGELMVASDSHSNMYGGVGCLGTPVVRTDAAAIWATQRTWWQVPEIVKVEFTGSLGPGVTGKDVIVALCGSFNKDEVLNAAIEFVGKGVNSLSIDDRLAISNMTTEWGALAGVFPIDDVLIDWYHELVKKREFPRFIKSRSIPSLIDPHPRLWTERVFSINQLVGQLRPDPDAYYSKTLTLNLSTLVPHVSGPNSVKVSTPLDLLESQNIAINKAYLVSCVNSRVSDLKAAAEVIKGRSIAPGVDFYVAPASSMVQADSEAAGDWSKLIAAGAKVLPAGCGPCIGLGTGLLKDGEVGISATNRNYKGRMGSAQAQAYLASPAVVAASAIAGKICGPDRPSTHGNLIPEITIQHHASPNSISHDVPQDAATADALLPSFPNTFSGPVLFARGDNINTDGIYPGKYTYQDDITAEQQAKVVMENYDPTFASKVEELYESLTSLKPIEESNQKSETTTKSNKMMTRKAIESSMTGKGVILITGSNFGTGSSREQAATSIKNSGIPLVFGKSFSQTFLRNAINNGLICLEAKELVDSLRSRFDIKNSKKKEVVVVQSEEGGGTVDTRIDLEFNCSDGIVKLKIKDDDGQGGEVLREEIYKVKSIGRSVQEIFLAGGLEGWVRERI